MYEDEDDDKDDILKMLGGEVDDYAGSQLEDPDKPKGVTITISMGGPAALKQDMPKEDEEKEPMEGEHDPIAHVLGMCGGGCPGE